MRFKSGIVFVEGGCVVGCADGAKERCCKKRRFSSELSEVKVAVTRRPSANGVREVE